jgi:hypothetical protein
MTQEFNSIDELLAAIEAAEAAEEANLYRVLPQNKEEDYRGVAPRATAFMAITMWIGLGCWDSASASIKQVECPVCFRDFAKDFGITNWLVEVWFDHYHGQGEFAKNIAASEASHEVKAYQNGYAAGTQAKAREKTNGPQVIEYRGSAFGRPYFIEGTKDALEGNPNKYARQ